MKRFIASMVAGVAVLFGAANMSADYNRVGVSYDNTSYRYNKDMDNKEGNFSANGFGFNYLHGFGVSRSLPMFVEVGLNANFDFSAKTLLEDKEAEEKLTQDFQDINFQIPVNYTYHFNVGHGIKVEPYVGLNFKLHLMSRYRLTAKDEDETEHSDWMNVFSKDDMGSKNLTWNRFQMGWHIGVGAEYKKIYLGLQYGTDFIPAYSYSEDDFHGKINTGNFRLMVGYTF